jgi:hypothetical protein
MKSINLILCSLLLLLTITSEAQSVQDSVRSVVVAADTIINAVSDTPRLSTDTVALHEPRKATIRSAIIPGWGQAYNKEYWKIPLVYAAIGVPVGFFVYNHTWYNRSKRGYEIRIVNDTASFPKIHSKLQGLNAESLRFYRNQFRRDRDYSIIYTLVAWGLNVADATVFAHLKQFDVSDDLSFKIKPGYSPIAHTSGISLVLAVKDASNNKTNITRPIP